MIQLFTKQELYKAEKMASGTPCLSPRMQVDIQLAKQNAAMPYLFYNMDDDVIIECTGENSILCGNLEPLQHGELQDFLQFMNIKRVQSLGWAPKGWQVFTHTIMRRPAKWFGKTKHFPPHFDDNPLTDEVLKLLETTQETSFPTTAREGFYADLCVRRNHGFAKVVGIRQNGKLVSTAGAYAISKAEVYIACVQTAPNLRLQGHAKTLMRCLCEEFSHTKMSLICEEHLCKFYTDFGFENTGEVIYESVRV